jgi:hypothetical protein
MGKGRAKKHYYAIYRGDEFLAHGPVWELALKFDVAEKSIREMGNVSHYKRVAESPNPEKRLIAVKVEELTQEDLIITHRKRSPRE